MQAFYFFLFSILFFVLPCAGLIIEPGVVYEKIILTGQNPVVIHELKVDPTQVKIVLHAAHKACVGTKKVSEMACDCNAIAGINGGFWEFGVSPLKSKMIKFLDLFGYTHYNAFPVFARKIDQRWFALSTKQTGVIAWSNDGQRVITGVVKTEWKLKVGEQLLPIHDMDKPRANGPIIYTSNYGQATPHKKDIIELLIKDGSVIDIIRGGGIIIDHDHYVYAFHTVNDNLHQIQVGEEAAIIQNYISDDPLVSSSLKKMDYVLASTPLLLKNNVIVDSVMKEKNPFYTTLHPRTAIGIFADGAWLFVVVDGRRDVSHGIALKELAEYLLQRGCVTALNLDGGGSSTLVINNKVINSISGREYALVKKERPVSDAILIMPK